MQVKLKQNLYEVLVIIKGPTNPSKLRNAEQKLFHRYYIHDDHESKEDWQFTIIVQCTTNAEPKKERSFQMVIKSVKNLIYNKLAHQKICFILILVVLT